MRFDNGREFISGRLLNRAEKAGTSLIYVQPGKPQQNAYVEGYNRTVRTECLGRYHFASIATFTAHCRIIAGDRGAAMRLPQSGGLSIGFQCPLRTISDPRSDQDFPVALWHCEFEL